ncbi:MAG: hypothetical protein WBZ05_10415 [Desulfobacterales bacterium]
MEGINSDIVYEKTHVTPKEVLVASVDKETVENLMDHYDEPSYFFRGAIYGFLFCVPFWAVIFLLIT